MFIDSIRQRQMFIKVNIRLIQVCLVSEKQRDRAIMKSLQHKIFPWKFSELLTTL